jgi:integrase
VAAVEAAKVYADTISGRRVARPISADLATAVAEFLEDFGMQNSPSWVQIVGLYFKVHLIPHFGSFEHFTPASYADYGRQRLQKVTRPTTRKELSALRVFVNWCNHEHGMTLPVVPPLPKHGSPGKRTAHARKRKATIISSGDAKRILMAMPERSRRTGEFTRPLFTVLYETALRPTTVLQLETPLHYVCGQDHLFITREIDKEGYERKIPLSPAARAALDRACPKSLGRIFLAKKSSLRHSFVAALQAAGLGHLNASPYDFRHTTLTAMANTPGVPLTGVSFIAGHKYLSTTSGYVQANENAAREALAVMAKRAASVSRKTPQKAPAGARSGARSSKSGGAKEGT